MPKRILLIAALSVAALTLPATAQAADICVGETLPNCPTQDYSATTAGLAAAIDEANVDAGSADRIIVAAGTYSIASGFSASLLGPTEIVGAGVDQTVFSASADNQIYLGFSFADPTSVVSGFTLNVTGSPNQSVGVFVDTGQASEFKVVDQSGGTANNFRAVRLDDDASVSDFQVSMGSDGTAVVIQNGSASVSNATLSGNGTGRGFNISTTGTATIRRVTVRGFLDGVFSDAGTINVYDSLFDLQGTASAVAFDLFNTNDGSLTTTANFERVTVYGSGSAQKGIFFGADSGSEEFDGTFKDSVIELDASKNPRAFDCTDGTRPVSMQLSNSAFNDDPLLNELPVECNFTEVGTTSLDGAPSQFANPGLGDFTPLVGSLLIDAGSNGAGLLDSAVDRAGEKRLTDGNGDCTAMIDPGAFEFQPTVLIPASCLPPPYVPPAPLPVPQPAPVAPVVPGATAKLTTRARKAFRRSRSGFRKRTNPRATAFGITYRNAQIARFELQKAGRGRKKGSRCVRGSRGKRCTYYKKLRGIQRQDVYDGEIFYQFGGRFGGRKLTRGNYRVKVTPFGQGAVRGKPIYIKFKLR